MSIQSKIVKGSFIVGCGHSGTSFLIRILGEHSQVYAVPNETNIFLQEPGIKQDLRKISKQLNTFDNLTKALGKAMWVEKTPKHVYYIDLMFAILPKAKIIGITRDPRDVACSIKDRGFTFEAGILRWIKDNTALLRQQKENVFIVKLEDIIKHPKKSIKRILNFLELPYENLLNYHLHPVDWYTQKVTLEKPADGIGVQNHRMLRNWQINQPIFKTTQRYKSDMTKEDKKIFATYAKEIGIITKRLSYCNISLN